MTTRWEGPKSRDQDKGEPGKEQKRDAPTGQMATCAKTKLKTEKGNTEEGEIRGPSKGIAETIQQPWRYTSRRGKVENQAEAFLTWDTTASR